MQVPVYRYVANSCTMAALPLPPLVQIRHMDDVLNIAVLLNYFILSSLSV